MDDENSISQRFFIHGTMIGIALNHGTMIGVIPVQGQVRALVTKVKRLALFLTIAKSPMVLFSLSLSLSLSLSKVQDLCCVSPSLGLEVHVMY
jgi:hypothetical protein